MLASWKSALKEAGSAVSSATNSIIQAIDDPTTRLHWTKVRLPEHHPLLLPLI